MLYKCVYHYHFHLYCKNLQFEKVYKNPFLDKILQDCRYPDVVTYANISENWLRALGVRVMVGQILLFSADFDNHPYHTLALPCE